MYWEPPITIDSLGQCDGCNSFVVALVVDELVGDTIVSLTVCRGRQTKYKDCLHVKTVFLDEQLGDVTMSVWGLDGVPMKTDGI